MSDRLRRTYQFSVVPEGLTFDPEVTDRAFRMWSALDRHAKAADSTMPTRGDLAEAMGISRATVDRALAELIEAGWLERESRRTAGLPSVYTLRDTKKAQVSGCVTSEAPPEGAADVQTGDSDMTQGVLQESSTGCAISAAQIRKENLETKPETTPVGAASASPDEEADTPPPSKPSKRGTRLPEDWEPDEHLKDWFRTARVNEEDPASPLIASLIQPWPETANFKGYWLTKSGKDATKLDWGLTWQTWMRREANRVHQRRTGNVRSINHTGRGDSESLANLAAVFGG